MPEVVEPGTRLVQRYRLERRLEGAGADFGDSADFADRADATGSTARTPWTYWRAEDELLARPVSVCLIDANGSTAAVPLRQPRG